MKTKRIVAIGDSFFYINDHLEETGFRLSKGILDRLKSKLSFPSEIINLGQNGWKTSDWVNVTSPFPNGDIYLIMLGTNDWWFSSAPLLGSERDYLFRSQGTILGNLGIIIDRIKAVSRDAVIFVCSPVERSDFVYINDYYNNAKGSYEPHNGLSLSEIANAINRIKERNVCAINTHDKSGITCYNAVKFKRCLIEGQSVDLPYPNYTNHPYDPTDGVYPYPIEAIGTTYDGLHPSDEGADAIANVIAMAISQFF